MIKELLVSISFCLQCPLNTMYGIHKLVDQFNKNWGIPEQVIIVSNTDEPSVYDTSDEEQEPVGNLVKRKMIRQKIFTIGDEKTE